MNAKEELIWMAGFFDGEGSVCMSTGPKARTRLRVSVNQRIATPLALFVNHFGGKSTGPDNNGLYFWFVTGKRAGHMLEQLQPYLIVKAKVAQWGIWVADTVLENGGTRTLSKEVREFRQIAGNAVKELNTGHRKEAQIGH